jgi:hypothetical protein
MDFLPTFDLAEVVGDGAVITGGVLKDFLANLKLVSAETLPFLQSERTRS